MKSSFCWLALVALYCCFLSSQGAVARSALAEQDQSVSGLRKGRRLEALRNAIDAKTKKKTLDVSTAATHFSGRLLQKQQVLKRLLQEVERLDSKLSDGTQVMSRKKESGSSNTTSAPTLENNDGLTHDERVRLLLAEGLTELLSPITTPITSVFSSLREKVESGFAGLSWPGFLGGLAATDSGQSAPRATVKYPLSYDETVNSDGGLLLDPNALAEPLALVLGLADLKQGNGLSGQMHHHHQQQHHTGSSSCVSPCQGINTLGLGALGSGLSDLGLAPFNLENTFLQIVEVPASSSHVLSNDVISLDILNSIDLLDQVSYVFKEVSGLTTVAMSLTTSVLGTVTSTIPAAASGVLHLVTKVPTTLVKTVTSVVNLELVQRVPEVVFTLSTSLLGIPLSLFHGVGKTVWDLGTQVIDVFDLTALFDLGSFSLVDVTGGVSSLLPSGILGVGGHSCCKKQSSCCKSPPIVQNVCQSHGHTSTASSPCGQTDSLFGITVTDPSVFLYQQDILSQALSQSSAAGAQLGVLGSYLNGGTEIAVTHAAHNLQNGLASLTQQQHALQSSDWLAVVYLLQSLRERVNALPLVYQQVSPSEQALMTSIVSSIDAILPAFTPGRITSSVVSSVEPLFSSLGSQLLQLDGRTLVPKYSETATSILGAPGAVVTFDFSDLGPSLGFDAPSLVSQLGHNAISVPVSGALSVLGVLGLNDATSQLFSATLGAGGSQDLLGTKFLGSPFLSAVSPVNSLGTSLPKIKESTFLPTQQSFETFPTSFTQSLAIDDAAFSLMSLGSSLAQLQSIGNNFAFPLVQGLADSVSGEIITSTAAEQRNTVLGGSIEAEHRSLQTTGFGTLLLGSFPFSVATSVAEAGRQKLKETFGILADLPTYVGSNDAIKTILDRTMGGATALYRQLGQVNEVATADEATSVISNSLESLFSSHSTCALF